MNKLFTKVAALTVGLAMAAGVGVALGSAKASEAKAGISSTPTWSYDNASFGSSYAHGTQTLNNVDWYLSCACNATIGWNSSTQAGKNDASMAPLSTIAETTKYGAYQASGGWQVGKFVVSIANTQDSVAGTWYIWYSSDNGVNWTQATTGTLSSDTTELAYDHGSNFSTATRFAFGFGASKTTKVRITINEIAVYSYTDGNTYTVTDSVEHGSVSPTSVNEGETLTATITPDTGYELPATLTDVTMGGNSAVYSYNAGTGVVTVNNVSGDIVISGSCPEKQAPQPVELPDGDYTATLSYANPFPTEIDVLDGQSAKVAALTSSVSAVKSYDDTHHEYVLAKDAYFEINNLTNGVIKSISFNLYQYRNMNVFVDDSTTAVYTGDGQKGTGDPVVVEVETNAQSKIKVVSNGGTGSYDLKMYSLDINIKVGTAVTPVTGVSLNAQSGKIAVGTTRQLTATVAPSSAKNKNVSWSAEPESVATVSSSGLVTGVAAGEAVITVTTEDGGFTASYTAAVGVPNYGTESAPLTVEEAREALEYTDASVTSSKLYVYGKVYSSKYSGTTYNDYTIWLTNSDESVDKYFEIYGGEISQAITSDDTADDALKGETVICHGYGKIHNGSTFELLKANNEKPSVAKYVAPQPATYEVSFYEGNTGGGTQYAEGAKVTIPQPTESLIPEGKEFDYWEHKETGDHYAPGDEFTVGTSSARFDAVYKDAAATDWTDAQKEDFTAQLDGYVPPFFGELVGDLNVGQNSIYFTVSGDITADFATKLGSDWTAEDDGSYTLETSNGSIMAYASLDGSNTYVIFQFNAAPVQTDWSDTFKATWNERFVSGDSQIAALPPFLGAELSSDANVSWNPTYPYADIDVVDGTDLAIFNAIDNALDNSADWQYVGKLEQGVGYVYVEKTLTAYAVVYAYAATETEIHSGVTFEVVGSISADTTNAKLEYFVGDTIDISGVVVHFALLDGTWIHSAPFVVPISYCTPDITTFDAAGSVTVTLDVAGVYTVKYQVTVSEVALTSLEVSGTPSVTEYKAGEEWNPEGLVVTATYNNGTTADVTNQVTWTFDPAEVTKEVELVSVTASLGDVTSAPFAYAVSVFDGYDANQFARDLLDAVEPICANYDGKTNNKLALRTVWETMSQRYASLSGEEKAKVIEASAKVDGTDLEKAMAFYNYACKKYGLTKFIEGRQVNALVSTQETSSSILPIIVIVASSIAAVTAIGVVIGLKRRKSLITK